MRQPSLPYAEKGFHKGGMEMIPVIGWVLVAGFGLMAASCRREQEPPPEDKKNRNPQNCPEGGAPIEVEAEGVQVQLCHQEPKDATDGIYQKRSDGLGLKIDDRFIPSSDPQFQSYQEKFHLPDFEGLSLRLWAAQSREVFPPKTYGDGRKYLASILKFCTEKGLDFAEVKRVAAKIGPFAAKNTPPRSSPEMTPEEKMQAFTIVSSIMALRKEDHGFYGENRKFVDTVFKIIEAGKLKIRNWEGTKAQVGNGITDFIVYNFEENGLEIASHLDPNDERAVTSMIHELYHLYQDHQEVSGSMLKIETQAYFKASEYVWQFYERGVAQGKYKNVEDFIQKSFPNADTLAYHPIALSFRALVSRKSGDQKNYEANLSQFKQAMNIQYYLGGLLSAAVNEAVKTPLIPADYGPNDLQKLLRLVELRIERLRPEKERKLKALRGFLKTLPNEAASGSYDSMKAKFFAVQVTWISLILNEKLKDAIQNHKNMQKLQISPLDPLEREMLDTLAKLNPLEIIQTRGNGVGLTP